MQIRDVVEATVLTFVLAVLGIATKGLEPLALFWPANGVLIGWFLRRPARWHPLCWAGVVVAFVAADLCYGRSIELAAVLLLSNLVEIAVGLGVLASLGAEGRELAHPPAVLRVGFACILSALAGGVVSALGFALLGDPAVLLNTATWWMSEIASLAAVLPVALTFPAGPWRSGWLSRAVRHDLPELAGPVALLVLMAALGVATGGIGTTGYLLLPLIWSAMRAGIFATTVLAALAGLWIFAALGLGLDRLPSQTVTEDPLRVLLSVRLSVALTSLAAVLVASIMATRRRIEERLAESERRLALAFEGTTDGIWDLDVPSRQLSALDSGSLAARPEAAPRRPLDDYLRRIHPDDRERASTVLEEHLTGRSPDCVVEYRWPAPDGGWIWQLARGRAVEHDAEGRPLRIVGSFMDVSARKALEQKIEYMANHDALTGLANRHALDAALRERILAYRSRSAGAVLMVIDLDGFKAVNDGHGHLAGDTVLRALAQRLSEVLPEGVMAARVGGDEFALLGGELSAAEVEALADRIGAALAVPIPVGAGMVSVGASVGWAFLPGDAEDEQGLSAVADARLYAAKQQQLRRRGAAPGQPSRASA
ncbi:sensor domain-containing diguanylate cyclase [Inquilinus limosus]|uniref:sensor domain-containing diguanylate cyclase n=1 Tax=Inquilinus limosus TaxID=171674 RepID=UPI0003F56DBC|nr:sensor domain-containing diguanylate cyclase [Inquilinus limosus]